MTETQLFVALRVTPIATLWRQATVAVTRERRYTGYHYALTLTTQRHDHITPLLADLAAHTSAHPVQAVRAGLPVRSRVRTELPAERHLPGRECGITASSADLIVPATRRTTMGAGPRLRRRSTARLQQSAGRDPSQPISGCLQTFTQNSLLYSVFLLTLF